MAYGLKHRITFIGRQFSNDINDDQYYLNIYEKDYTQIVHSLMGANPPFVIKFLSGDDPFPIGIRASECEANYFNDGSWPLLSFYSEDDEKYRFDFYAETIENVAINKLIWSGYLMQDNCEEQFKFPPYVVTLKGTDNLGLLKEIPLNTAFEDSSLRELYESETSDVVISDNIQIAIQLDLFTVSQDLSKLNILVYGGLDYHITSASFDAGTHILTLTTEENFPANGSFTNQEWSIYSIPNLHAKISLFSILQVCLEKTGIILPLRIYTNLYENTTQDRGDLTTATFFEQTYIFGGKYENDDGTYKDCYSVIDEILKTFNCQLSQSEGFWTVVRWPEAIFFTDNAITGTEYAADFTTPVATTLQPEVTMDQDGSIVDTIFINATHEKRITRPYKTVKETFNYEQPVNLIRNINLDEQGVLLNSYIIDNPGQPDDGYIVREYELPYWFPTNFAGQPNVFLRVISSPVIQSVDEIEVDRYIVLSGGTFGGPYLQSSSFYIDINDRVTVSFQVRTSDSNTGSSNMTFLFQTDNGTGIYKINWNNGVTINGSWATNGGAVFSITSVQDLDEWTTFTVESLGTPVEGYFSILLNQCDSHSPISETQYKDIRVDYIPYINDTSKIIGHYHLQTQDNDAKNVFEEKIFIDDSPKHSISGALFTNADTNGDFITLTQLWHRLQMDEGMKLGQLTTYERKFMYSKARTSLEGDFFFVRYGTDTYRFISLTNIIKIGPLPGLNFIIGPLTIDFFAAVWSATLFELYNDGDAEEFIYTFKYITETT